MANFVISNFFSTTVASALSRTSTSLSVTSAANAPTIVSGSVFPLVLTSASNSTVAEIVYCTAISGTTLTIERAQEGTTAQSFSAGDFVTCTPTAGTFNSLTGQLQIYQPTSNLSLESVLNTIVLPGALTAAITVTLSSSAPVGARATIFGSASAYPVSVTTGVSSGSPFLRYPDGSTGYTWAIPAASSGQGIYCVFDGTNWHTQTFGATVIAPAVNGNQAVQLNQLVDGTLGVTFTSLAVNGAATFNDGLNANSANGITIDGEGLNANLTFTSSGGTSFSSVINFNCAGSGNGFFYINGTQTAYVTPAGNWVIDAPTSGNALTVDGTVYATTFDSSSDERLKDEIQEIPNALEKVSNIRGVTYRWKVGGVHAAGVVAQDVQKSLPVAVHGKETLSVDHIALIGLLMQAVRELSGKVSRLESLVVPLG